MLCVTPPSCDVLQLSPKLKEAPAQRITSIGLFVVDLFKWFKYHVSLGDNHSTKRIATFLWVCGVYLHKYY